MMIDYEKLKIAHTLIENLEYGLLTVRHSKHDGSNYYFEYMSDDIKTMRSGFFTVDIDELIAKLKELTRPEPKYSDGQEVWLMYFNYKTESNEIQRFETDAHRYVNGVHQYCLVGNGMGLTWRDESEIYPSKKALINAQISHWIDLKNKDLEGHVCFSDNGDDIEQRLATFANEDTKKEQCEHERDTLENNQGFSFYRNSIGGGKYYFCHKTNDIYCQCGFLADFPHKCQCKKCGEYFK